MSDPIFLFLYSNSNDAYLNYLEEEDRNIRNIFIPLEQFLNFKYSSIQNTNEEDFLKITTRYFKEMVIFHYGGHAGTAHFLLKDEPISSKGIANQLSLANNLILVFLNGCSTVGHVKKLLNLGIKVVIATNSPIDDYRAKEFATKFYSALSQGSTIKESFKAGLTPLYLKGTIKDRDICYDIKNKNNNDDGIWGLFNKNENIEYLNWKIDANTFQNRNNNDLNGPSFDLLVEKLKKRYIGSYSKIPLMTENIEFKMEDFFIRLALVKENEVYQNEDETKLIHKFKNLFNFGSYEDILQPKESIEIEDILRFSKRGEYSRALILGKAGIGKTTLSRFLAYTWANGRLTDSSIELVIYYELRDWNKYPSGIGLMTAILQDIFSVEIIESNLVNKFIEVLTQNKNKILIILDGYDELKKEYVYNLEKVLKDFQDINLIVTSRPYNINKSNLTVNETFETIGFFDEDIEDYVHNYFRDSLKIDQDKMLLGFFMENRGVKSLIHVPIILEIVCNLWKNNPEKISNTNATITSIYSSIVEYIYQTNKEKNNIHENNKENLFLSVGRIAYDAMISKNIYIDGKNLENSLSLLKEELKTENVNEYFLNNIQTSGFFRSRGSQRFEIFNEHYFIHLSFQEYFAAYYISKQKDEFIIEFIINSKLFPPLQLTIWYLFGLLKDKKLIDRLFSILQNEFTNLIDWRYEFVMQLKCLEETQDICQIGAKERIIETLNNKYEDLLNYKFELWISANRVLNYKWMNKNFIDVLSFQFKTNDQNINLNNLYLLSRLGKNDKVLINKIRVELEICNDELYKFYYAIVLYNLGNVENNIYNIIFSVIDDLTILKSNINVLDILSKDYRSRNNDFYTKILNLIINNNDEYLRSSLIRAIINLEKKYEMIEDLNNSFNENNMIDFKKINIAITLLKIGRNDIHLINFLYECLNKNLPFNIKLLISKLLFTAGVILDNEMVKNTNYNQRIAFFIQFENNIITHKEENVISTLKNINLKNCESILFRFKIEDYFMYNNKDGEILIVINNQKYKFKKFSSRDIKKLKLYIKFINEKKSTMKIIIWLIALISGIIIH